MMVLSLIRRSSPHSAAQKNAVVSAYDKASSTRPPPRAGEIYRNPRWIRRLPVDRTLQPDRPRWHSFRRLLRLAPNPRVPRLLRAAASRRGARARITEATFDQLRPYRR